jgi:hypothetical protein
MGYLVNPSSGLELKQIVTTLDNSEITQLDSNYISIGTIPSNAKIISIQMSVDAAVNNFGDFYIISASQFIAIANFTNAGTSLNPLYIAHFSIGAYPQLTISGYELKGTNDGLLISTINQPISSATQMKIVLSYFD